MGQRYWRQASADLTTARSILAAGAYYAAADFSHEAAEKALKAACWHRRAAEPPWTHDLGALAELAADRPNDIPADLDAATTLLEAMFERVRYPSGDLTLPVPAELIDESDAREALGAAEEVLAWVEGLLQRPPGRPGKGRSS